MKIPLGFEVGTGEPVSIPLDHMLVTGRTRRSGKTTCLEAIVSRANLRALTFLTKPGEDTFANAHRIKPYFHDQGGWRFIASVLEATMGEKLKRERAEIINASKGAASLQDAYNRIVEKKSKARSAWVIDTLTTLEAYFEIVLPQIERTDFSDRLEIGPGINVIDLSDPNYTGELRSLVIRSALEWVLRHERGTLTVIPEAWQFIPNDKGNPVKQGCEALIRMGGVLNNWVALDSQEVTSIDAGIRKSCGVWILGVQRELNEVKRVIAQLPGQPKPKPDDVMQLGLGQFYESHTGDPTRKVYVWPAWMEEESAVAIAKGEKHVEDVHKFLLVKEKPHPQSYVIPMERKRAIGYLEANVTKQEADELRQQNAELLRQLNEMKSAMMPALADPRTGVPHGAQRNWHPPLPPDEPANGSVDTDAIVAEVLRRIQSDPKLIKLATAKTVVDLQVETATIQVDGSTGRGRIFRLLANGFFDNGVSQSAVRKELKRTGADVNPGTISTVISELMKLGFLTDEGTAGYTAVKAMKANIRK